MASKILINQTTIADAPNLIIGFSFSLMPDGSPGSYNVILAERLRDQLEEQLKSCDVIPTVALQWEIADALLALCPAWFEKLEAERKLFVVEPPKFAKGDVDEKYLPLWLQTQTSTACKLLLQRLELVKADTLTVGLNDLLDQSRLYEQFAELLLVNLERPTLGDLFTEFRAMPRADNYSQGLRRYQRIRINRLVIESIVDDPKLLMRGQYLSTAGVIDSVFEHCSAKNLAFDRISVVAHPLHATRCVEQTMRSLSEAGLSGDVQCELLDETFPWDSSGAQVWCRSLSNWQAYEKVVSRLLAERSSR